MSTRLITRRTLSSGSTVYHAIGGGRGLLYGAQLSWFDGVTNFSEIKMYFSFYSDPPRTDPVSSADLAAYWAEEETNWLAEMTFGAADNALMVLTVPAANHILLKLVASADCDYSIAAGERPA